MDKGLEKSEISKNKQKGPGYSTSSVYNVMQKKHESNI